jgi:hypothetical protein
MSDCRLSAGRDFNAVCCAKISSVIRFALQSWANKQTAPAGFLRSVGEMLAVPAAIVALWVASLAAQVGVVWPNFEIEKAKSEQAEKSSSEDKSKKDKSQQAEESSPKNRPRKADRSSSAGASKGKERQHQE